MDGLDQMTATQLRTDPDFRAAFVARIIANLKGQRANRYDDAAPLERQRYAQRQLSVFGDIIGTPTVISTHPSFRREPESVVAG